MRKPKRAPVRLNLGMGGAAEKFLGIYHGFSYNFDKSGSVLK